MKDTFRLGFLSEAEIIPGVLSFDVDEQVFLGKLGADAKVKIEPLAEKFKEIAKKLKEGKFDIAEAEKEVLKSMENTISYYVGEALAWKYAKRIWFEVAKDHTSDTFNKIEEIIEKHAKKSLDIAKKEYEDYKVIKEFGWNKHFKTNYSWLILPIVTFAGMFLIKKYLR